MALSTLLLPSSSSTSAAADSSDRQRHHQQHHSKRKKKPPPPLPTPSPTPITPPAGSRRAMAAAVSKKSPKASTKLAAAKNHHHHRRHSKKEAAAAASTPAPAASSSSSSWEQLKSLLSCRSSTAAARVHDPTAPSALVRLRTGGAGACGASLCAIRDVVDAASSAASSAAISVDRDTTPLTRSSRRAHRAASSTGGGGGGHPSSLRGLSGCYECRVINVEPMSRRYPRPRELCACSQCGEVFTKADSLEHHQAVGHAVSELGPEDSGRNIVEIIFKSSWQKRDRPICQIDRILKVHNTPRTIARFEAYRDAVRSRCRATAARAAADGNELLRFHSAGLACALGLNGSTSLCADSSSDTTPGPSAGGGAAACGACGVCAAIRHGFAPWVGAHPLGVRTTASSGRAHDCGAAAPERAASAGCRAMLVCRVIAGRVRRDGDDGAVVAREDEAGPFDSVAGDDAASSVYGNIEELFVANPRAILPCFVVVYRVLD